VSKKQRDDTQEFRESAVAMVLTDGRTIRQAADNLGIPYHTIVQWVAKARSRTGSFAPPQQRDAEARIRELEAENRRLRNERDILKRATAFFAQLEIGQQS